MSILANVEPMTAPLSPQEAGGAWSIQIPGEPVAKGRPKLASVGGHARAFTPAKTRNYETVVRELAAREWNRAPIENRPIFLRATFVRMVPQSWSIKKRNAAFANTLRPTGRPDLDNCVKSITDALNGLVYADDALIVETTAAKVYGQIPHVLVTLTW